VKVLFVPEARLDVIAGDVSALQAGVGVSTPFSNYFSLGGTVGAGLSKTGFSSRLDLYARISLDPYHQNPWEPYVGGGGTVRMDSGGPGTRGYVLGFVGVNGPPMGAVAPGLELGFGGGLRFGVTLKWATRAR
jgi:hypothetical protein